MISAACFTLRGHGTHIDLLVFVSGRQDLPSDATAFSLTSFEGSAFKGLTFLQSASSI